MSADTPEHQPAIRGWHAHIYFDPTTRPTAIKVRERIANELGLIVGSVHDRPVGPHTAPMFQVIFGADDVARVVPWFALNRDGLVVLLHPSTGNGFADHTKHALWMGAVLEINKAAFR